MPTINPTHNPAHPSNFPVDPARPTTHNEMVDMWNAFRTDGFDDAEVNKLIRGAVNTGDVSPYGNAIMHAVVTPTMPEKYLDQSKFLEVLAWYIDKSSPGGGNGDGKLGLPEVEAAIDKQVGILLIKLSFANIKSAPGHVRLHIPIGAKPNG